MIEKLSEISKQATTNAEQSFLNVKDVGNINKNPESSFLKNDVGKDVFNVQEKLNPENLEPERIKTINSDLEGKVHKDTGVPFEKDIVELDNKTIEGVFPTFDSVTEVQLPKDMYKKSNTAQFRECNKQLNQPIEANPELGKKFSSEQLEQIKEYRNPDGYTWHHQQQQGKMQLVSEKIHALTSHTGGRAIWC